MPVHVLDDNFIRPRLAFLKHTIHKFSVYLATRRLDLLLNHYFGCASNKARTSLHTCADLSWPLLLACLFVCFTSQVNSYGHGGTVSSPNHTFFLGLNYFVHIHPLVTANNHSGMIQRKGGK